MSFYEYWIGKNIDFDSLWQDFEDGQGYIKKYKSMDVHLLRLTFTHYPPSLPLFNHEAIFKTVKGTFHDLKKECLPRDEYENFGPIFLYEINRGSVDWSFLAELKPLVLYGFALSILRIAKSGVEIYKQILDVREKNLEIDQRILSILDEIKARFPDTSNIDSQAYIKTLTSMGMNRALAKLIGQGLDKAKISKYPFSGNIEQTQAEMIDLDEVLKQK